MNLSIIMANLSINGVVLTTIAVSIGLVMIGSLLAPIAISVMSDMEDLGGDGVTWASLVGVTVIMAILGLVIVAVNNYTKR